MTALTQIAARLADGSTTSSGLVDAALARVDAVDAVVGAFLDVDRAGARVQAEAADQRRAKGARRSVLDGVPIALKDNLACEGRPLTAGSRILEGYVSPYDATVTSRLKAAGAVIVGTLNCDEFAMGSSTENSAWKPTKNPHDVTRVPGGSSGGSAAAVAAGMVAATLGSDTGGSIRQPASLCGVVGVKPSYGRVSRFGLIAFASSLDVVGPLTHDVESAALMLHVIAGHDARDATCVDRAVPDYAAAVARGKNNGAKNGAKNGAISLRVGVPRKLLGDGLDAEVRASLDNAERALKDAGAAVVDVDLPHAPLAIATYYVLATAEASSNLARYDGVRYGARRGDARGLLPMYEETRALFGAEVKRRIVLGSWVLSAGYYDAYTRRAQRVRALVARDFADAFATCDVLLTPTSPEPAWKLGAKSSASADPLAMYLADAYTVPASLAGLPGISLPCGFTRASAGSAGLPIGAQIIGRAFDEATMFTCAAALEKALAIPFRIPHLDEAKT